MVRFKRICLLTVDWLIRKEGRFCLGPSFKVLEKWNNSWTYHLCNKPNFNLSNTRVFMIGSRFLFIFMWHILAITLIKSNWSYTFKPLTLPSHIHGSEEIKILCENYSQNWLHHFWCLEETIIMWGILGTYFVKNYLHVYYNVIELKWCNTWQVLEKRLKLLCWRWTWSLFWNRYLLLAG